MKKLPVLIFLCAIVNYSVYSQAKSEDITNEFFEQYKNSPMEAVDYAFSTNQWFERNMDAVENVKSQLDKVLNLIGEYYGHEIITEKSLGQSLKLVSYLVKYNRQPLRFTFVLYKPKDRWQVQNFLFDDNLGDELKEAGKINNLLLK